MYINYAHAHSYRSCYFDIVTVVEVTTIVGWFQHYYGLMTRGHKESIILSV